ncbi:DNA-(apurinic or apyrimidinic site) lyase /Formamidopyrimidine-DNA glycosylase [Actinomadura meyerae]|jgi:formamidopyrimidine-DNA glycosylase|uniref:DNA-(Apurinic or apyrimidinic site) lyase /Formamidopyrimidine-DNA glycosylase n=1 Tax=Actinomadura meyerae TaxID=240840 RepID=A0A239LJ60_9ACTN|nr:DNA-formamidopyrimidine glycosylase family protein [Actinomadura meyerae]SNT29709.1 DNA-(apurinic or apyrimidinic site) lyase /Formamidopyrimidine-DNA glycosylase [Actinomadura meyerae]
MPELPDVEGFRRVLAAHTGEPITAVDVLDAGVLRGVTARALGDALRGRRFAEPRRHGKWLIAPAGGPVLLLHFGMTGSLTWHDPAEPRHRHDRVVWRLPDGELRYRDMRKLQGVHLDDAEQMLADLGPDALEVSRRDLAELLSHRRGRLKSALTDQTVIAGLGNFLADEICWHARVNPLRTASDLDAAELTALHRALRRVLRDSVEARRVPPRRDWLTGVRDDPGAACPRCGTPLCSRRVSGRRTVWCPVCQPS